MKEKLQRIKIAEACGWTEISERCMWGLPPNATDDGTEDCLRHFPKYESDLNAMHEAEKVLTDEQRIAYSNYTYDVACKVQLQTKKWSWISLTAAQRAEAFLRTLGLWEEGE